MTYRRIRSALLAKPKQAAAWDVLACFAFIAAVIILVELPL